MTHFAVMLANYLASKERRKVALAEINGHGDFAEIQKAGGESGEDQDEFQIFDVDYYKNVSSEKLTEIINNHYQYLIIDFGSWDQADLTEFLRCSKKILIGGLCEWKRRTYFSTLEKTREVRKRGKWKYLTLFGESGDRKQAGNHFGIKIKNIPLEPDAFLIQGKNFKFFQELV